MKTKRETYAEIFEKAKKATTRKKDGTLDEIDLEDNIVALLKLDKSSTGFAK
jgi:hypothetical protein